MMKYPVQNIEFEVQVWRPEYQGQSDQVKVPSSEFKVPSTNYQIWNRNITGPNYQITKDTEGHKLLIISTQY